MKTFIMMLVLYIVSIMPQQKSGNETDIEAVKKVIQSAYVEGLQNEGDFEKIDQGFHPCFKMIGWANGDATNELTIYAWKENIRQGKLTGKFPRPDDKKVTVEFMWVDIEDRAAVAKFKFFVGGKLAFYDYISLNKFEDGWKIIAKTFDKVD